LLNEYVALRRRYGVLEQHPRLLRLEKAVDRRSFRVRHLREQIEELASELRWLESEMESFDKGREVRRKGLRAAPPGSP
jgi:predicted RNase H-like nuclease (RuvC/YqgF family)